MRFEGPTSSRFDHHPEPRGHHPNHAIAYLAVGPRRFVGGIAEYFQDAAGGVGPLDVLRHRPVITQFRTAAGLRLLDLDSGWVTRAGGNQAIISGPRSRARAWARCIYLGHEALDGLAYRSSVWGPGRCVALWERGRRAFPASPGTSRSLADPTLTAAVASAARELGTFVV